MRKTIDRELLIMTVNDILAAPNTKINNPEYRGGVISGLEAVLFNADCYKGYRYLFPNEMEDGDRPGVNRNEDGSLPDDMDARFADCDRTRRAYF